MIQTPHTYSEWTRVLDTFKTKQNDAEIVPTMQEGTLEWQTGVAERFFKRISDAVNSRMNMAKDKFDNDQRYAKSEGDIIQALLTLRKEMAFLKQAIASISALPEEYRQALEQCVVEAADETQNSLEKSAKNDRSGKMACIVRNNRVNKF